MASTNTSTSGGSLNRIGNALDVDVSELPGARLQFTVEADGSVHFWGFNLAGLSFQVWGTEFPSLPESEFTAYVRDCAEKANPS
jgi:hypothetical protein